MCACPFSRRTLLTASRTPAATRRTTIVPQRRRCTFRVTGRVRRMRRSAALVVARERRRRSESPRLRMVSVSSRPSRRRSAALGETSSRQRTRARGRRGTVATRSLRDAHRDIPVRAAHHPTRGGTSGSSSPPRGVGPVSRRRDSSDRGIGAGVRPACGAEGGPVQQRVAQAAPHALFTSRDAGRTGSRDSGAGGTSGSDNDAAAHVTQSGGDRERDPALRSAEFRTEPWRHPGDGPGRNGEVVWVGQVSWRRERDSNPR